MNEANLKMLIADDHFLIRQFVRRTLMDAKIGTIDMVNDGAEAVGAIDAALASGWVYDVLFLDWNMPNMSGFDVLTYARSKPQYAGSAIIMFTAESEKANIMKAVKAGATSYILKPISPVDLSKKVREMMDWLQARRTSKV